MRLSANLKPVISGVLITDHNVRDTTRIVDRAYVLHDGMVMTEGSPEEIVDKRRCPSRLSGRRIFVVICRS